MEKKKIQNLRKCIGCGEIRERSNLIRIMKNHITGDIIINPTSHDFGRSSYLCYNKECLKNAIKKRRLQKTLKKEISSTLLDSLEETLN